MSPKKYYPGNTICWVCNCDMLTVHYYVGHVGQFAIIENDITTFHCDDRIVDLMSSLLIHSLDVTQYWLKRYHDIMCNVKPVLSVCVRLNNIIFAIAGAKFVAFFSEIVFHYGNLTLCGAFWWIFLLKFVSDSDLLWIVSYFCVLYCNVLPLLVGSGRHCLLFFCIFSLSILGTVVGHHWGTVIPSSARTGTPGVF
jgi:hypothetical protein